MKKFVKIVWLIICMVLATGFMLAIIALPFIECQPPEYGYFFLFMLALYIFAMSMLSMMTSNIYHGRENRL